VTFSKADEAIIDGNKQEAITLLVAENMRLTRVLRKYVKWFDKYELGLDIDERDCLQFRDLRDMRDEAREVLIGVSHV
jgi:hypothetical protein